MENGRISSDLLRGHTDTIILNLLSKKDCYGYEIRKAIAEKTGEQFDLKEATLYASFKRLESDGAILSYWGDESRGGRRKYYRITNKGIKLLRKNINDWRFTADIISSLLDE
ncbi:MAG: PadR family transcriptional regulator [Oscillospiraceae bacterium]|nr:PadR family transcriptional regulator [Oscillospiraceae bacterium]